MTCLHKSIANMDHIKGMPPHQHFMTNRMCMKCGQHWYGAKDEVVGCSKAEWDKRINSVFDEDKK